MRISENIVLATYPAARRETLFPRMELYNVLFRDTTKEVGNNHELA